MSERLIGIITSSFFKILIPGIKVTIPLTILSFALSLVVGLLLALIQVADIKGLRQLARFYIWVFRGTPLIVQLFIIFFGLPNIGITLNAFPSAVLAFGLNLGAYNAEVFRSAILAIPKGQMEAAYMIGLSYPQAMIRVILPQSFPVAFPNLFNNLISLLKDTALASSITVIDLFTTAQQIAARTYEPFALYLEAAFIYLIFSTALTWLQRYLEQKLVWKSSDKKK
ncbi:amino acid ABC transporter permease protein [Butyrivibrio proteoclasticus B316]|uniref:Amino acid ABC transporter permease protein n=1 Tax=Butyrivibrio proteoclasticus (strain ATCC 51982 / DSM 14932 / B316) TaxID=515622 RepID=E0RVE1_BUTPB|nr:amino acid ABC transporter permease [Butyrivibrio proteoclasticus]ADL34560.1 amino acid ABC transporter permease protein [Butyrivibrio proteoclasticus B316]